MPIDTRVFEFAEFRIDVDERVLYRGNAPVRLAPKVFDTLLALVSRQGRVVSKDSLMQEIWGNTFVEENNLTQHIFTLRKILSEGKEGQKFIETVPRVGYRFLPDVKVSGPPTEPSAQISLAERVDDQSLPSIPPTLTEQANHRQAEKFSVTSIMIVCVLILAVVASLGFALQSRWRPATESKNGNLVRLTDSGNLSGAAISPDGKFFAYVMNDAKSWSIRLKNIQTGSEVVILQPVDDPVANPRFSPDGNLIFFSRGSEVFQMPVLGGESRKIASNLWSNFSVSPDGKQIAFPRSTKPSETSSIIVANTDGSGDRVIATRTHPDSYVFWGPAPVFSLDGTRLTAVASTHGSDTMNIVEIDCATGEERDLKMDVPFKSIEYIDWKSPNELLISGKRNEDDVAQIWSVNYPDGATERVSNDFNNYLSFTLSADRNALVAIQEAENLHLWIFDSETGAARQITSGVSRSDGRYGLSFAPDGRIVFTARDKLEWDIYEVSSDGGEARQITKGMGRNVDPVVSPDNQYIAFVSDRDGEWRLWRMNRDGNDARRLTTASDDLAFEETPYFSPDGRWIYYVSTTAGHPSIRKVSVEGGDPVVVSETDKNLEKPVVSPDGKSLAYGFYNVGAKSPWQIAVHSLDGDSATKRFFDFPAFRLRVRWMLDSSSVVSVDDKAGRYNLWVTDLNNGERRPITNFTAEKIYRFDVAPDRRKYVLARGDYFYDAVLIGQ